jgi:poly-gamma-glutamate capsule biosynthesis protein CapA/YwtB (metallophosphatase superfamily)
MKKLVYLLSTILLSGLILTLMFTHQVKTKPTYTYAAHQSTDLGIYIKSKEAFADFELIPKEPINIIFAGDTLFDWSVKTAVQNYGPDYPFEYVAEEVKAADLSILNLETAVTHEKEKDTVQLYNFKSDPIALEGVKNAGFDMVTLANNHALDYQIDGFLDTLKYLESYDLKYFGAGKDKEEAYAAQTVEINGKTIKILGFSRFMPAVRWYEGDGPVIASAYQKERVFETIKRENEGADVLLVYIHWGVEKNNRPEEWQRQYAREMIDLGVDAVIGAHPHVLQGFEYYNGKPIAYSLGNFLFPDYVQGKTAQTGLLTLTIDGDLMSMKFNPYLIRDNQIHPLEGQEDELILQYLQDISYGVDISANEIVDVE